MSKPFTYALLLAAMLGLAACEQSAEDKVESAKENASEAMESLGEAAKDTGAAIEQKTDEVLGKEPTTGEKVEDAAGKAADAIEEAGDEALMLARSGIPVVVDPVMIATAGDRLMREEAVAVYEELLLPGAALGDVPALLTAIRSVLARAPWRQMLTRGDSPRQQVGYAGNPEEPDTNNSRSRKQHRICTVVPDTNPLFSHYRQ